VIPFIDFGGAGPLIHFANANGYPARTYTPLIETLTPHYRVLAMVNRAQWPEAKPADLHSWEPFVDDLLEFLTEQGNEPVIGIGHSLGGVVTLAAALRQPERFRAVVLLDPVLFRRRMLASISVTRKLGLLKKVHPLIPGALKRRRVFANADEMFSRYRKANVFKRIDDRGLRHYVDSLAQPRPDGQVELSVSPEWEARIYETGPLNLWSQIKNIKPPMLIIRGPETDAFFPAAVKKVRQLVPQAIIHDVPETGHLVPMEKPDVVGKLILDFLNTNKNK
jgi:pimeloyl-ACP methyl ester carboxylesterase